MSIDPRYAHIDNEEIVTFNREYADFVGGKNALHMTIIEFRTTYVRDTGRDKTALNYLYNHDIDDCECLEEIE